jgi:hypothetical protein
MADTQVNNGRIPASQKIKCVSGPQHIFSVRKYFKKPEMRPMVAFNVTDTHAGFFLSAQQLIQAGVVEPGLLQDTKMHVIFYEKGEVLPLTGVEVTDGGTIVKSFTVEEDKELLRAVALDIKKTQANNWMAAAQASSVAGRRAVTRDEEFTEEAPKAEATAPVNTQEITSPIES